MGALKPIFDWDTPTSYDQLLGVVQAPTLKCNIYFLQCRNFYFISKLDFDLKQFVTYIFKSIDMTIQ